MLAAAIVSLTSLWETLHHNQVVTELRLQNEARKASALLDVTLDTYRRMGEALALSPLLVLDGDLSQFHAHARALAEATDTRILVIAMGPEYRHIVNSRVPLAEASGATGGREPSPGLQEVLDRLIQSGTSQVSNLVIGRATGRHGISIVVPVRRDNKIVAVVVIILASSVVHDAILEDEPTISGEIFYIVDGVGNILTRAGALATTDAMHVPGWFMDATRGKESGVISSPGGSGEIQRIAFWRAANAPNWIVAAGIPTQTLWVIALTSFSSLLVAMLFSVGVVFLLLILFWNGRAQTQLELDQMRRDRARRRRLNKGLPIIIFHVRMDKGREPQFAYLGGDMEMVSGWSLGKLDTLEKWQHNVVDGPLPRARLHDMALTEGASEHEFDYRREDGSIGKFLIRYHRLESFPDGGGELVGYLQDITAERASTVQTLHAARLASLGEMSAALAHELRQPLAIMSFAAENAIDDLEANDLASARGRLARIIAQSIRAGEVIDHLRAFSRGDSTDTPLQPVSAQAALSGALTLVSGAIQHAEVTLHVTLGETPILVMAHQVSLEQILVNLLMNAVDVLSARPPGGDRWVRISVAPDTGDGRTRIMVADSGGGIPEALLPRVFEPFVTTKIATKGTGLGLSLCHGIMQSFGGSISAVNGPGGAVFTLEFRTGAATDQESDAGIPMGSPIEN